jgi:hypothetical protein
MAVESKRSKVVSFEFTREWDGKFGKVYYHHVKFENGDAGDIGLKKKDDNSYFTEGKEVDYTIEQTTRTDGVTKDWKIGKPQTQFGGGGGVTPKGKKEYKVEAAFTSAKIAAGLVGLEDMEKFKDEYKKVYGVLSKHIDNIYR